MSESRPPVMLLVLGVHRSGTSVTARMLECLGARPSDRLHEPLPNNPKGFFEDVDVERFDEYELLPALSRRWHDLAPPDWTALDPTSRSALAARAEEIVRRNFRTDAPLSVLKEPRICVLLPFWLEVLESIGYDVRIVCAVRDPLSVARSLQTRDGFSLAHGGMLYASNWIAAHQAMGGRLAAYVAYDALLADPAAALARVAGALRLPIPDDFDGRIRDAREHFLDPNLRHSSEASPALVAEPALPPIATSVFEALGSGIVGDSGDADAVRRGIAGLQSRFEPFLPLLRDHDRMFDEHRLLGGAHANLANEAAGLRSAVRSGDEARARVVELESRLAIAVAETGRLVAAHAERVDCEERLLVRERELLHVAEMAQAKLAGEERTAAELRAKLADEERAAAKLRMKLADEERAAAELRVELAAEERAAAKLGAELAAEERAVEKLRATLVSEARAAADLRAKAVADERAAAELRARLAAEEGVAAELRAKLADEERAGSELRAKLAAGEAQIAEISARAARSDAAGEELRRKARGLERALTGIESSISWRLTSPGRRLLGWTSPAERRRRHELKLIRESGLFDPVFYALQLPPADRKGIDPLGHYLEIGGAQGLAPSPFFDGRHYLEAYPDVREADFHPLLHFLLHGRGEGRKAHANAAAPSPIDPDETPRARAKRIIRESGAFDVAYYLDAYPDVRDDGMDPIRHYVVHGWEEGRNPSATFDTRFYIRENLQDDSNGECPLVHYVLKGRHAGLVTSDLYRLEALRQREAAEARTLPGRARRMKAILEVSIRQQGGIAGAARRACHLLASQGPRGVLRGVREQLRGADRTLTARTLVSGANPAARTGEEPDEGGAFVEPIPATCKVLFIGCDGHLAGSQVLLLNLLRWLRAHTSVEVATILLGNGELVEQYARCGPVIVWPEFSRQHPDPAARRARLKELFGDVDLVYGNTVVAAAAYGELASLEVPILTHVHELEKSIRAYVQPQVLETLRSQTRRFVACSAPVAQNLADNHGIEAERLRTIEAFIPARAPVEAAARAEARRALGIAPEAFVVVGCGTIYWRKGVDLFVETAIRMREQGAPLPEFIWIGAHHWDNDAQSRQLMPWKAIEQLISANGLDARIRFTGQLSDPRAYFEAADVFFLPSREDPYPLVCLEAAQAGTPVVCFDGAGGMPAFVSDDAGIVVPYLDVDAAAAAIRALQENPARRMELGGSAARKVARLHTDDVAVPALLDEVHRLAGTAPLVSVVVPVYNHAAFLERRMESILGQTFRDFEIILLDDASTDESLSVARRYAHLPNVRIVANDVNSGSAFRQWAKGIALARGEFVWIAEGDDASSPEFLHRVLPSLSDPSVVLAYADSRVVDEHDRPLEDYRAYYDALDPSHWKMDHRVPAEIEINFGLGVKNTIPNVSAAVFRRSAVGPDVLQGISSMRFAGDWMFYVQLAKGRRIAFVSLPLNVHRKHSKTLTHQFNNDPARTQSLLDEVRAVHEWVLGNYPLTPAYRRRLAAYLRLQIDSLFPGGAAGDDERRYPMERVFAEVDASVARTGGERRRVAFVTTNDFSHDGGSEQLWIHAALAMAKSGHAVMVVIRRWSPEPYFLEEFRRHGVEIAFKDAGPESELARFGPELVVINIGDQDDGVEWYEHCRSAGLRYAIVNHLTKEPRYWPIRPELQDRVREGNLCAERVLFTSRNNRSLMERRLGRAIPHAGTFHNPLFLDRSRSLPFPPVDGPLRVAMPARLLDVHKGQRVAIEVFSMPKWQERPIELHLYGNGPDEKMLRELARRGGSGKVHFHEPRWQLPHPDMEGIWRQCHALLMSSYMEGMPLVLLNAMFYGRVPIVTDIGGHREVVEDGLSGFIASEPTLESVDEALERAWRRRAEWEAIGARAREAMLRFAPEDPVADLVEKIQMTIAGSRSRGGGP